jgi:tetratricopeptide (TPR) repeat protein
MIKGIYNLSIDPTPLWDFSNPELSEERFRAALATASGDDALILQTQIARTYGLRTSFERSREILAAMEPGLQAAGAEPRARHALELGRSYSSATHPPETQTPETLELARAAYLRACEIARSAGLDGLAVDALHMLAFVDTAPEQQLKWGLEALAVVEASSQPAAKKWEASLRNNIGYSLHQLGRNEDALAQFEQAVVLRERGTDGEATRAAHWMVAWTYRSLKRIDEALAIQLRLESECEQAGLHDPFVLEELELLYRAKGDEARASHYASLKSALERNDAQG